VYNSTEKFLNHLKNIKKCKGALNGFIQVEVALAVVDDLAEEADKLWVVDSLLNVFVEDSSKSNEKV
jgi:hypothetical protein